MVNLYLYFHGFGVSSVLSHTGGCSMWIFHFLPTFICLDQTELLKNVVIHVADVIIVIVLKEEPFTSDQSWCHSGWIQLFSTAIDT